MLSGPMADARTTLNVAPRTAFGSRTARRMRREGLVPGVVYSGGAEATAFQVSERDVRGVIAEGAALFDLSVDGGKARPVVVKEQQLHPVKGTLRHIDLQEVKLDIAIEAEVTIELEGVEDAPGVKAGGTLEHVCKITTYLLDRAYREPVYNAVSRHLRGIAPCGTGLIVSGLAMADMLVEFDVDVVIPTP